VELAGIWKSRCTLDVKKKQQTDQTKDKKKLHTLGHRSGSNRWTLCGVCVIAQSFRWLASP
jgi:hypothetical protein